MRVLAQLAQIFMASDAGDFHDVEPTLDQTCCRIVPQVVKEQVLDASLHA